MPTSAIPDPLLPPLDDNEKLVAMLVRLTGATPERVRERLYREQLHQGTTVREAMERQGIPMHVPSPELDNLYANSDAFLYELIVWNRDPLKVAMRAWIAQALKRADPFPRDVLAFGDGVGFDSLHLARAGHTVTFFELSGLSNRFARELFSQSGATGKFFEKIADLVPESFDAILCLDVLEHVQDPPGLIELLAGLLRPGGLLFVSAPFFLVSPNFGTHLRSNQKFSGRISSLYGPHGLALYDGNSSWSPLVLKKVQPGRPAGGANSLRKFLIRACGLPYFLARFWPAPLVKIAAISRKVNPEWLKGLEPAGK